MTRRRPIVLLLSGLDPANIAGYGKDLEVVKDCGAHAVGVVTTLTAQTPETFSRAFPVNPSFLHEQLSLLFAHYSIQAIKVGMLFEKKTCEVVGEFLKKFSGPIVVDPLLHASCGPKLLKKNAFPAYKTHILRAATLLTPNLPEAHFLIKSFQKTTPSVKSKKHFKETNLETNPKKICQTLFQSFPIPLLLKGGHALNASHLFDVYYNGKEFRTWKRKKVVGINTHGTGCILSSAISAGYALGLPTTKAIDKGENILSRCFRYPVNLTKNKGNSETILG